MRNFKVTLEYDGTDFHGWQQQPGLRTVQGVIEEALARIMGQAVAVNGAGRTDAGVHALGQVCSFSCGSALDAAAVAGALGSQLPDDVLVRDAIEVDPEFHARFSAVARRYIYFIRVKPTVIWRRYAHIVTAPLDLRAMREAATLLLGEKDFSSFTPTRSSDVPTVCRLSEALLERDGDTITLTVEADHFLHHMVRVIVGTLIDVGRGRTAWEQIDAIIRKKDRRAAGPTVPPNGLFLAEVKYSAVPV